MPPRAGADPGQGARRAALGATVPADAFGPAAVARAGRVAAEAGDPPALLDALEVWSRLARDGRAPSMRFESQGYLGRGSTSEVFAVRDRNLGRDLAVKVLAGDHLADLESVSSFLSSAQLTAALRHPNILQVVDLDLTRDGRPYLSMHRIEGRTLGARLEQAEAGALPPLGVPDVLSIFIAVCQALAYAHHRRVIHQDIKPDNLLIGDFGEVVVLDWGSAMRLDGGDGNEARYGTPLYMAPEQARREPVDERADVYAIGASLFHALVGRLPMWTPDPEAFWARKRAGELDPPTAAERAGLPPELIAISLRAMAADPARRYRDAGDLREDLSRYQNGLAVSAYRGSWRSRLMRWHRRHARALWTWTAVAATFLVLLGVLYGQRLREVARWGSPAVSDEFSAGIDPARWQTLVGGFAVKDGMIESTGAESSLLLATRPCAGPTAVEYDAEVAPGAHPGDLSVWWARDLDPAAKGRARAVKPVTVQIGAFDGTCALITDHGTRVDFADHQVAPGTRCHVRVEVVDSDITLWIDGARRCHYTAAFPLSHGYLLLFAYYPGKRFGHVRIYDRGQPELVEATAIGDALAEAGQYGPAEGAYARVARDHGGSALAQQAVYKQGLCHLLAGEPAAADAAWAGLTDPDERDRVALQHLGQRVASGDDDAFFAEIDRLCAGATPAMRHGLALLWDARMDRCCAYGPINQPAARHALAVQERCLAQEDVTADNAGRAYINIGRPDLALARYPDLPWVCAGALLLEGRPWEAYQRYRALNFPRAQAQFDAGLFDQIRDESRDHPLHTETAVLALDQAWIDELGRQHDGFSLFNEGRIDELRHGPDRGWRQRVELLAGEAVEPPLDPSLAPEQALMRGDRAAVYAGGDPPCVLEQHLIDALDEVRHSRAHACQRALARWTTPVAGAVPGRYFLMRRNGEIESLDVRQEIDLGFVADFCDDRVDGGHELSDLCAAVAADPACRYSNYQVSWHAASYLRGDIDAATFRHQPYRLTAEFTAQVLAAMRAEMGGQDPVALAAWRAAQAMPFWCRGMRARAFLARVMDWRIAALGGAAPAR